MRALGDLPVALAGPRTYRALVGADERDAGGERCAHRACLLTSASR
jgi:hypothetical protein